MCFTLTAMFHRGLTTLQYPTPPDLNGDDATTDIAEDEIRCGAHTDYGSLTLLFQCPGQPGLEVQTPDSSWMPVSVFPPGTDSDEMPPIVVNIGDMLSYWTNGYLKSTKHRVVMPSAGSGDRYSVVYFCHPAREVELVGVPSPQIPSRTAEGTRRPITAAEHLRKKLAEAYGRES